MYTRFVYNSNNMITGFNFDIDLAIEINKKENIRNLLYVYSNPSGKYLNSPFCMTIANLTEQSIKAQITFDEVLHSTKQSFWANNELQISIIRKKK